MLGCKETGLWFPDRLEGYPLQTWIPPQICSKIFFRRFEPNFFIFLTNFLLEKSEFNSFFQGRMYVNFAAGSGCKETAPQG